MSTIPPLSLSDIVDITVTVAPAAASANPFNQGLFVGPSTVIPSYGANSRVRQYTSLAGILADGFNTSSPEYIAGQIYFSQNPVAQYFWIGRQDLTAVGTLTIGGTPGTGYAVGDLFTVTQGGASNIIGKVTAAASGIPSAVAIYQQGTGAAVASNLPTVAITPSTGTGLTVDITTLGESLLQAATACRAASALWYGIAVNNPADADNLALSEWADAIWQTTRYYPWSASAGIPANTADNIALQLQTLSLRVMGVYSTTQGGLYPNNIYAAAAVMGVEMGLNTGLANSFFTAAHKQLAGIAVEPLTQTQYANIKSAGFNAYCNFAPYQLLEPGYMSNGAPSYLWLFLAMLVNNLQIDEINVLQSNPAVSQTNSGQQLLINAANNACALLASIGFISGGVWEGLAIPVPSASNPALSPGQALPIGYLNVSPPYVQQSAGDHAAGKAMPIYCMIITAGAVQSLVIAVYTQL